MSARIETSGDVNIDDWCWFDVDPRESDGDDGPCVLRADERWAVLRGVGRGGAMSHGPTMPQDLWIALARAIVAAHGDEPMSAYHGEAPRPTTVTLSAVVIAAAVIVIASQCMGCVTARDTARTVVYASAEALDTIDQIEAARYVEAHEAALAASTTLAEYVEAMAPHNEIEAALVEARSVILAARALVAAWDAGAEERWLSVAGCIASAMAHVVSLLEAADVDIPPEVGSALALAATAGAAVCAPGGAS